MLFLITNGLVYWLLTRSSSLRSYNMILNNCMERSFVARITLVALFPNCMMVFILLIPTVPIPFYIPTFSNNGHD